MLTFREYRFPRICGILYYKYAYNLRSANKSCYDFPRNRHEAGPALVAEIEAETVGIEVSKNMTPVPGIMKKIAKCESNDTHFKANGEVLTGNYDPRDIGRYQIIKVSGAWKPRSSGTIFTPKKGTRPSPSTYLRSKVLDPGLKAKSAGRKKSLAGNA